MNPSKDNIADVGSAEGMKSLLSLAVFISTFLYT